MLEFNATVLAQIVDFIILIGILSLIFKYLFKRSVLKKVERMEADIKEIKEMLQHIKNNNYFRQ